MPKLFLPDTTVLINFAIVQRMDVLGELITTNGAWSLTVARECSNSAAFHPALVGASPIFGTRLIPDSSERIATEILRTTMAAPGEPRTKHLGEAETVAIISNRGLDSFFLTDDRDARALAQRHGIAVASTWDLLRLAYRTGKLIKGEVGTYLATLKAQQRGQPPGFTGDLDGWLGARPA